MIVRRPFWVVLLLMFGITAAAIFTRSNLPAHPTPEQRVDIYSPIIYLCGFLLIISFIWAVFSTRGLDIVRKGRGVRQQIGLIFEERFELINRWPFLKLWIEVQDQSNLPGSSGSRVFSWIGGHEIRTYQAYTLLTRRGEFHLGPTILWSGDPFGLFAVRKTIQNDKTLLVLPHIVTLDKYPHPPGLLPGGRALRRKTLEVTPHAAGVREYAQGDSLNRIHWPTTARREKIMVKEFEQDPQADVWVFLDAYKQSHYAQDDRVVVPKVDKFNLWRQKYPITMAPSTFEYAVSACASIAEFYIRHNQSLGFVTSGQVSIILSPERGERQLGKILETLALLQPKGDLELSELVEAQAKSLPRGSTVVLITPSGLERVGFTVDALQKRGLKPAVVLIDPTSFGGPLGVLKLRGILEERRIPTTILAKGNGIKPALEEGS